VAADEVAGAGGCASFKGEVRPPGRVAGGGDEATGKATWFSRSPTVCQAGQAPLASLQGQEALQQDDQDAVNGGKRGESLADIVKQGSGEQVGVGISPSLQALENCIGMCLLGGGHSSKKSL